MQDDPGIAIEACADKIDELFESYFEDHGVEWNEENLPEIREEAESMGAYLSGKTSFEQFRKENGIDPSIQAVFGEVRTL